MHAPPGGMTPLVNEAEHTQLFERLETKDNDTPEQHDNNVKEASIVNSDSFALAAIDDEAKPFIAGFLDHLRREGVG